MGKDSETKMQEQENVISDKDNIESKDSSRIKKDGWLKRIIMMRINRDAAIVDKNGNIVGTLKGL